MTWLLGVVLVTVTDPGAEPVVMSCLQVQKIASPDGTFVYDTGPVQHPAKRTEIVATDLHAARVSEGALGLVLEVEVEREGLPSLFLHDELRVTSREPITVSEGPLSVTVSMGTCTSSRTCLDQIDAASDVLCAR